MTAETQSKATRSTGPKSRATRRAVSAEGTPGGKDVHAASAQAHNDLRHLILSGELTAGAEYTQSELGRLIGAGRTPLRDALRLLEREGLVLNSGPHRSVQISPLSMTDLDDLYSMRVTGEALAAWLTVPVLRSPDFDRLERELDLIDKGDREAHRRFHAGLRVGAGARLTEHLAILYDHAERYQRARLAAEPDEEMVAARLAEHRPILEAFIARDRVLARDLTIEHVAATAQALMTAARHAPYTLPTAVAMAKTCCLPG
ncbi:GntR family transcriptional regulator [Nocardia cyriacigeorgica]|uniref:DNA-binding transcriptional regulator CsiR n=1 Tax=Nocardia cyriacigeorgica TaxID=135487 RepID=A0A4U8W6H4_9NOCA|nr:GntR family transcriptional regulator [Nocardia cyriacigeorgica]MBF6098737.1 GntR family transcriptional regulator [Nocardia cyriacigeorgica]MBF6161945.1 GntR family transcriptional regulator [Nocardia cyriacigeorgica]MBF6200743.1 GntR family transcriptional regulator [Nocardia cyriacigeorgica]MBF6317457.1 GntR family transcriptional regulator [Nocardia cyriacigeorgica]MBF6345467.1 GntR family transcriptional regulator [Nocardia cyriacigeorgica]